MTKSFNTLLITRTMGALLLIESLFMCIPLATSLLYQEAETASWMWTVGITAVAGCWGLMSGRRAPRKMGEREGYLICALVWIVFSVFGMLPFYLSGAIEDFTDAFFETISGFSTTGATILTDIEVLPHSLLLWRSLMQWLGGMGIIVLSVAILPLFGLGGMQLYAAEATGVSYEKLSPRIADTAKRLWGTYVLFTLTEAVLLKMFGMGVFDSICHSLSTIATGGFSTKNLSIAYYQSPIIEYIVGIFTMLSGINFALIIYLFHGKPGRLWKDEETHWYLGTVLFCSLALATGLFLQNYTSVGAGFAKEGATDVEGIVPFFVGAEESFRHAFFEVVCTMTSCGFAVTDYMQWRPLMWVLIFMLMFTGGCAGSTAGGIKWVRIVIFAKNGLAECQRRIHPNAIIPVRLDGKALSPTTINNVMAFLMFYILIIILGVLAFCAMGVDFEESIGAAVSAIGNVGPALGQYGPAGTFASFPTIGKWVLALLMMIGRLEVFTIILLFSPALWRK